jgi:hypothetical protein
MVNNVTALFLYETVICANLYGLFLRFNANQPVVPGIFSKPELLRYTRTLYLEYPNRHMAETHELIHLYPYRPPRDYPYDRPK